MAGFGPAYGRKEHNRIRLQVCNIPRAGKSGLGQDSNMRMRRYPACHAPLHCEGYGNTAVEETEENKTLVWQNEV